MQNKKLIIFILLIVGLTAAPFFLPMNEYLQSFLNWTKNNGQLAIVIFILAYIAACVFLLPGLILTLGAGFIFGLWQGFIIVSIASTLGATLAFIIGRFMARDWIQQKTQHMPRFRQLDQALGQQDWLIVLLTRLSPIFPFNILNYAYGITATRLWSYVWASWIGMMPGTLLYVYFGSAAGNIADLLSGKGQEGEGKTLLLYFGLAATLAVTIVITKIANKALKQKMETNA